MTLRYAWSRARGIIPHTLLTTVGAPYGVTDEWHQMYVPVGVSGLRDRIADVVGLSAGYGLAVVILGRVKSGEVNTDGRP